MKQILKSIFTLCLLFVGVGSVMAEDDVIILKPTDDIQLRNNGGAAQPATGASYEFGSNSDAADNFFDFCALQKFDLTAVKERVAAGSKITKVTLTLTNSSNINKTLHLYKCDYDWTEAAAPKWADVNIESYVVKEGEVGSGNTVNGGAKPFELKNKEAVCPYDITKFQNVITDDKLMAYVNGAKGNSLGILIALGEWRWNSRPSVFSKDATAKSYGTSDTDEYKWEETAWVATGKKVQRYAQMLTYFGMTEEEFQEAVAPKLTVYFSTPKPDPVVNTNSKAGFTSLADAINAATAGDVLEINEDLTISSRVTIQKQLTIQAATGKDITIKRDGNYKKIVFLANIGDNQGDVTFRGGEGILTFDGANVASTDDFFDANNGKITLDGVTIKNCASTNKQGTICCNKGGGFISVNNVTIDNCSNTTSEGYPALFFVGTKMKVGRVTVTNTNVACIYLENKNRSLEVIGEMDNNPLKLFVGSTFVVGDIIVKNCSDASKFVLTNAGYKLVSNGTNLVIAENPSFNLNVTDLGWASMYLDFAATVPTGATAYYASNASSTSIALTAIEAGSVIPANTGVIVKAAKGEYHFSISAETPAEVATNLFEGVTVDTPCEAKSAYVLSGESTAEKPIFGLYTGTTLGANKAFLPLDKVPASAKGTVEFTFEGTPTGIMNLTPALNQGEVVNLQGIKVNKNYNGVVIKNGKKYLNK